MIHLSVGLLSFDSISLFQLYSAKEKAQIKTLIDNMLSFSLTYQQEKTEDGQYRYVLEPKIDKLARYDNRAAAATAAASDDAPLPASRPAPRQLTYAAKQMIARELELERMRRSDAAAAAKVKASPAKRNPFASPSKKKTPADEGGGGGKSPTLAKLLGGGGGSSETKKNLFGNAEKSADGRESDEKKEAAAALKPQMQIKLSTPTAKSLKPVVLRDFFGRIIEEKVPTKDGVEEGKGKGASAEEERKKKAGQNFDSIWFCFKEGYSNAVRKPVKMVDLL